LSIAEKHLQRGDLASAEGTLENIFTQLKSKHLPSPSEPKPATAEKSLASPHAEVVHTGVILIVEDNPNESQLLAEILGLNGFQVQTAMDGNQAMLWLETNTPDVILMDMHMAHCDGPTTIRRIREVERLRSIPIFAVTGASREEIQAENCGEFEVQDWFQKPVKSQPLMHAIDDLVTQAMRF
jgi:CheY-like chemotaxis protein